MKRSALMLALLLAAAPPAWADPHGEHRGPPIDKIAADLGLDDAQKTEVQRILEEHHTRMLEERRLLEASGQRPTREEMQQKFEQSRSELETELSGVLTADQLATFKQHMQEHRSPRHGPAGSERPSKPSKGTDQG